MNKLDGLSPKFCARVEAALARMNADDELHAAGVKTIIVVEGKRELTTQMAYFARGRMAPDDVRAMFAAAGLWQLTDKETQTQVTWTLKSKHIDGVAIDLCPSRDGKSCWWDAPDAVWRRMAEIAADCGMSAGYWWAPPKQDRPHFEAKA